MSDEEKLIRAINEIRAQICNLDRSASLELIESLRYVVDGLKFGFKTPTEPLKIQDVVHFLEREIRKELKRQRT